MIRPAIKRNEQGIHARSQNGQKAVCDSRPKGVVNQNTVRAELSLQRSQDRRPPVGPGSKERQHGDAGTTGTEAITNGRNIAAHMFTRPEQKRNKPSRAFRGRWTLLFSREDLQLNRSPTNALQLVGKGPQTHGYLATATAMHHKTKSSDRAPRRSIP